VLEDADEIGENVLFFVYFAEVRNFGGGDSLEEEHFLIGNVDEFPELKIEILSDFVFVGTGFVVHVAHE
jgi:hypothetical protein